MGLSRRRVELPELGEQKASEPMLVSDSVEPGVLEWSGVVGEFCCAEVGEDAEGEIETPDEDLRWKTHQAGGDVEVGD